MCSVLGRPGTQGAQNLLAHLVGGLAVPAHVAVGQRHAQLADHLRHLLAHVQAVGELAPEDGHHAATLVDLDLVFA